MYDFQTYPYGLSLFKKRKESRKGDISLKCLFTAYFLFASFFFPQKVFASKWFDLKLGLALNIQENIRKENNFLFFENDPIVEPFPSIIFRIGPIILSKDGAGLALVHTHHFKLAGTLLYEGEPYDGPSMDKRERSFFLGGLISIYHFIFQAYKDVTHKSKGIIYKLTFAPEYKFGGLLISPRAYIQKWDQQYVDYYFGVKTPEVDLTRNRFFYQGSATLNYGLFMRTIWSQGRWKYFTSIGRKFYGQEVRRSPTVKKGKASQFIFGFMYDFL